jgi:flagellar biosynthesis/type III secretory pathway chaperone
MDAKIIELLAVLDDETACYRDMRRVLDDEDALISLSRRDPFDQVQCEKESLVVKLRQFEKKRSLLVDQLSDACGSDGNAMTVSHLARCVHPPYDEKLVARAHRLRSIIGDVHEKNRRNQLLINQCLDLIRGASRLLTHLQEDNSVYPKPGTHAPAVGYRRSGGRFIRGTV